MKALLIAIGVMFCALALVLMLCAIANNASIIPGEWEDRDE